MQHGDLTRALLDALFANSSEAIVTVDGTGTIGYATAGTSLALGYDSEAVVGSSVFGFLHPDDVDAAAQLLVDRLDYAGADLGHEVRLRNSSGSWISAQVTATLLPESPLGAIAVTLKGVDGEAERERSLRRQLAAEEYANTLSADFMEAIHSNEVIDRLQRSLGEIGLLTGAEIVSVFLERHERDIVERLAHWVHASVTPTDGNPVLELDAARSQFQHLLTEACISDDLDETSVECAEPITGTLDASSWLSAPFVAGGQRGFLALMRIRPGPAWYAADVRLVRNVAGLHGRALGTARSEELLRLTYREGPMGFAIHTWDGALVDCNQQYLELVDLSREQAEGSPLWSTLDAEDRNWADERTRQLRRGDVNRLQRDVRAVQSDGSSVWIRINSVPLKISGSSESFCFTSAEDVSENHAQRAELEYAARHDPLTGVANRDAMLDTIDRILGARGRLPSLMIIDLDRFKLVNDSMGHVMGDRVLREVAERLQDHVRGLDVVARLGGDEFAIVLPDITVENAERLAGRLRRSFEQPLEIDGRPVPQTISIGVAMGEDCKDSRDLLVQADRAMYAAKAKGRNRAVVFDELMRDEDVARLALERELRHAIDHGQLEMHFQPEFALDDRRIVGAEALLRWRHPARGLLSAGSFIQVAEDCGMIDDIGRLALREACRSFAAINAALGTELPLRVNISAREFARPELPDLVRAALDDSGLRSDRLCLEMTETTVMDSPEVALDTFTHLHEIGVEFAIDDFGTGYSSLTYLKGFPVDAVKIDCGFIEDIVTNGDSQAIVASIVSLSRALSLQVVAEGIESDQQLEILRNIGCERGQGFLVAGALPPAEFLSFLQVSVR